MISTVVFDFDGTLVDSNPIKRQGFVDIAAEHAGGPAIMRRILERVSGDRHAMFAAYVAALTEAGHPSRHDVEALVLAYSARVDAMVADALEMPGATALLQGLRRHGRRTYLSSATPLANLRRILERRGWTQLFDDVFGYPANKREVLLQIQQATGVANAALAVVGDGADDRAAAAAAGCVFFAVGEARGRSSGERVFTLSELLETLLQPLQQVEHARG